MYSPVSLIPDVCSAVRYNSNSITVIIRRQLPQKPVFKRDQLTVATIGDKTVFETLDKIRIFNPPPLSSPLPFPPPLSPSPFLHTMLLMAQTLSHHFSIEWGRGGLNCQTKNKFSVTNPCS